MADRYLVPRRLDDPELIGFWTIDEFAGILIPFAWGILSQHIFIGIGLAAGAWLALRKAKARGAGRSEEHTSELQSLMRISYDVFSLKKKQIVSYYDITDTRIYSYIYISHN